MNKITYKEYFAGRDNKSLRAELKDLEQSIYDFDCFGVRDLIMVSKIREELQARKEKNAKG